MDSCALLPGSRVENVQLNLQRNRLVRDHELICRENERLLKRLHQLTTTTTGNDHDAPGNSEHENGNGNHHNSLGPSSSSYEGDNEDNDLGEVMPMVAGKQSASSSSASSMAKQAGRLKTPVAVSSGSALRGSNSSLQPQAGEYHVSIVFHSTRIISKTHPLPHRLYGRFDRSWQVNWSCWRWLGPSKSTPVEQGKQRLMQTMRPCEVREQWKTFSLSLLRWCLLSKLFQTHI